LEVVRKYVFNGVEADVSKKYMYVVVTTRITLGYLCKNTNIVYNTYSGISGDNDKFHFTI